jgi:hypothetical protein
MSASLYPIAKFRLGRIVATPNVLAQLTQEDVSTAIRRHQSGDWGDLDEHDRVENELSLKAGFRLFSVYHAGNGTKFYVITEADRTVTTLLLPQDY